MRLETREGKPFYDRTGDGECNDLEGADFAAEGTDGIYFLRGGKRFMIPRASPGIIVEIK